MKQKTITFNVRNHRTGNLIKVIVPPVRKKYAERTALCVGQLAGEIIDTSTVTKGQTATLLHPMSAPQLPTSEPLPQFSRSIRYGADRFAYAKSAAEAAAVAEGAEGAEGAE